MRESNQPLIAVCIPCKDEAPAIGAVIEDMRRYLPDAWICVVDNGSSDRTAQVALAAGATVISEPRLGKGQAVARAFADVDADCYILIDGDGTYDAAMAPQMAKLILTRQADMVTCARRETDAAQAAFRRGHRFGNRILTRIFQNLFNLKLHDTLSGYRAMSHRFVKSFPTTATGFEIEAELNIHAAIAQVPVIELEGAYHDRIAGTISKLSTYKDGMRILRRNLRLFRDARPFLAFNILATPWFLLSAYLVGIAIIEYISTGLVQRFPSLIAGVGAFLVGLNSSIAGIVLERVARNRREAIRLAYLALGSYGRRSHD